MLLQLQKHLQTEMRPFQVRSHVTQKTKTDIKNLLHTKVRYCSVVSESVVICQLTLKMAEEIDFENWWISNFKGLVTLTLDRVIRHTVVHHSSTSTYIPNFIRIGKTFCGRTDVRTDGHLTHVIRSTLRSRPKNKHLHVFIKTFLGWVVWIWLRVWAALNDGVL